MERTALKELGDWWARGTAGTRKPLVLRGARQVGKSFLVRDFCKRRQIQCLEINFERDPSMRSLFVDGPNSRTLSLLQAHFGHSFEPQHLQAHPALLFLDEIQAAPAVLARLRYFYEESPHIAVIAAGSLLEFALGEFEHSIPVGRIEYLHLGPMRFEEFLLAQEQSSLLLEWVRSWSPPSTSADATPEALHLRLLEHARDFSLVGGMPEAVARFSPRRNFLEAASAQRAILETYRQDFGKYRRRIPLDRLDRVFRAIPAQISRKWVHSRVNAGEKARATEAALEALCMAKVAHRVFHASGNGLPLGAERKDNLHKTLFLDVGLVGLQLGLDVTALADPAAFARVNEGSMAEQWIGQHLLDLRPLSQAPELYYWVREKTGALAEVDYLVSHGTQVIPVEVKAGATSRAKSLQVFMTEKKQTPLGVQFHASPGRLDRERRILQLPFYLVEQLPRILSALT